MVLCSLIFGILPVHELLAFFTSNNLSSVWDFSIFFVSTVPAPALDFSILLHDTPLIESLTRSSIHNIPSHHLHESFGKCPIFASLSQVPMSEVFRMSSPSKGCVSPRLLGNLLQTLFSSKLNRYRNCPWWGWSWPFMFQVTNSLTFRPHQQ